MATIIASQTQGQKPCVILRIVSGIEGHESLSYGSAGLTRIAVM